MQQTRKKEKIIKPKKNESEKAQIRAH